MGQDNDALGMNSNRIIRFLFASGFIFLFGAVNYAYGQSDFYLEAKVNTDSLDPLEITKFEIQGKIGYEKICPSLQCKIDYKDRYTYFDGPSPQDLFIRYSADFRLQDDITHADLGPKKKEAVEQYDAHMSCPVDDIIEENGQELYYCHDKYHSVFNKFDKRSWGLYTIGIFDAKNDILKISGNFTGP